MKQNYFDFIICGAGASGLLLLKAIREDSFFNEKSILIIEKEIKNVNDRTWSYWESPNGSFDSILSKKWSKANFCSEDFDSDFDLNPYQYKMLRSAAFYQSIRKKHGSKNLYFISLILKRHSLLLSSRISETQGVIMSSSTKKSSKGRSINLKSARLAF